LRADTKTSIATFDNFEMDLSLTTGNLAVATGGFYVVETDDDTEVTDITPSKLSWKKIKGSESGATVANVPLSDTNAVRGSDDVVALQFDVEADETSAISMDEATVKLTRNDGTVAADQQDLASVALYKGSVSEANLLDRASGSKIATDGSVTFDGFDIDIAADATQTFVVTLSFVDGLDPVGFDFEAQLTGLSLEDDDSDDVTVATLPVPSNAVIAGNTGNREITVTSAGSITTLETKSSRSDNEYVKSVLAGTSKKVVSYDVRADNEEVDVETVVFTYDDGANNLDLGSAGATASLYLGDTLIATNSNSDITSTTITFDNLTTLIIPETTSELKLAINTEDVGQDKVGSTGAGLQITNVSLQDMEGASSGIAIANMNSTSDTYSQLFSVVPATVVASVNSSFGTDDGSAEVTLTYDAGDNTSSNGDDLQVEFVALDIEVSSFKTAGTLTLFNGNGDQVGTVAVGANGTVTINLPATAGFDETVTDNSEKYRIESTAEASFRVAKDGVDYNVDAAGADYTMLLQNSQSIGTYAESN
jgi:hypothetical protein